jgi:hypothetical protein
MFADGKKIGGIRGAEREKVEQEAGEVEGIKEAIWS